MRIGIMTFHWATNYGAVLQAYALVKLLHQMGYDAEDIDYVPSRVMRKLRFFDVYLRRFQNIKRAAKFRSFRKKYLTVSDETYRSRKALDQIGNTYDAVITGSDQIWNESFLMTAEKEPVLSYFLDFIPNDVKRISYAASFGTNEFSENLRRFAIPALRRFDVISLREENAVQMLAQEGINASVVCDPTLLLEPEDYEPIVQDGVTKPVTLFNFILRRGQESSVKTEEYARTQLFCGKPNIGQGIVTVQQWLWLLKNCEYVVTDSFHCVVFAILFHKPFVAVNDRSCSMNARIRTLTEYLGLTDRVIEEYDVEKIDRLVRERDIRWDSVDEARRGWAAKSAADLSRWLEDK